MIFLQYVYAKPTEMGAKINFSSLTYPFSKYVNQIKYSYIKGKFRIDPTDSISNYPQ
jgi:hypothetical protein